MPSDPTTKDLIAHAREAAYGHTHEEYRSWCTSCLRLALADRLEEVEEERDRLNAGFIRATAVLRSIIRNARTTTHQTKAVLENTELGEAVFDLRERMEALGAARGVDHRRIRALEDRLTTLETEARHRVTEAERRLSATEERARNITHAYDIYRRVEALEGHAERGAEAEAELRAQVEDYRRERIEVSRRIASRFVQIDDRLTALEASETPGSEDEHERMVHAGSDAWLAIPEARRRAIVAIVRQLSGDG